MSLKETVSIADLLADLLAKVAQAFAVVVGGIWVLRNYILNRTHVSRLQLELKATVKPNKGSHHLVATVTVKNLGLSVVEITERGSGLMVYRLTNSYEAADASDPAWNFESIQNVFTRTPSIEPGITVNEEFLFVLPAQQDDVFLLRLRIVAHGRTSRQTWLSRLWTVADTENRSWNTNKILAIKHRVSPSVPVGP